MSEKKIEYLIDTDVLLEHLTHEGKDKSLLEKLMECGICYTTVINSAEIYFSLRNSDEKSAIDSLMRSVRVLGLNSRYSLSVDQFIGKVKTVRDALFCATAKINKLIVVSSDITRYSTSGLEVIDPEKL